MILYLILYRGKYIPWAIDSINPTREQAEAKLTYERMAHPDWTFVIVEVPEPEAK